MFIIEVPYFNLTQIYNSMQVPRWMRLKDNKYVVIHKDKAITVEQKRQRLIFNCSEEEFYNTWFHYFDLKTDYFDLNMKVRNIGRKFKIAANRGNGIHILNQDPFELYIYCRLATFVGFRKASELLNRIAVTYGTRHKNSMGDAGRVFWYEWPSPEELLEKLNKEKESSGKVKPLLKEICESIVNGNFDVMDSDNELFGLFCLRENIFPLVDVEEVLRKNFDCEPEEFADWYLGDFEDCGLVYTYILHHIMNPPNKIREVLSSGVSR